jgi:hypothetical protein
MKILFIQVDDTTVMQNIKIFNFILTILTSVSNERSFFGFKKIKTYS